MINSGNLADRLQLEVWWLHIQSSGRGVSTLNKRTLDRTHLGLRRHCLNDQHTVVKVVRHTTYASGHGCSGQWEVLCDMAICVGLLVKIVSLHINHRIRQETK